MSGISLRVRLGSLTSLRPRDLLLGLVGVNLLVLTLLLAFGYDALYALQSNRYDGELEQLLVDAQETFSELPQTAWRDGASQLENRWDLIAEFIPAASEEIDSAVRDGLPAPPDLGAYVDDQLAAVYLDIGDDYVLFAELMSSPLWLVYLVEIGIFFIHLTASILLTLGFCVYALRRDEVLKQQLAPMMESTKQDSVPALLSLLAERVQVLEERHNDQLASHKDLLHGVAHELRSPLARMRFALDMSELESTPRGAEMHDAISTNIDELDSMIAELLDFARLQHTGEISLGDDATLCDVAEHAIDVVASVYPEVNFSVRGGETESYRINESQLVRALVNLLRNAGRYAKTRCELLIESTEKAVVIHVDDDGVGIAPGKRQRIFEPFTRLDPSRSRDSGGTGLGLSIVASIARLHGGDVKASESPLGGARFTLSLPLTPSSAKT